MANTSKITVDGIKYAVKDQYLRDEIEKLQDPVTAGEGIEISSDGTISLKEENNG
jgi:hypothetical protein